MRNELRKAGYMSANQLYDAMVRSGGKRLTIPTLRKIYNLQPVSNHTLHLIYKFLKIDPIYCEECGRLLPISNAIKVPNEHNHNFFDNYCTDCFIEEEKTRLITPEEEANENGSLSYGKSYS